VLAVVIAFVGNFVLCQIQHNTQTSGDAECMCVCVCACVCGLQC